MIDQFHERLARVALTVCSRFGFALAGTYALRAHGFGARRIDNVLLHTSKLTGATEAMELVGWAYEDDGLIVDSERMGESFVRFRVNEENGPARTVELSFDYRSRIPVAGAIGPVLHVDDAVAGVMAALYGRSLVRDFVDIYLVLRDGRYTHRQLIHLLRERDAAYNPWFLAGTILELPHIFDEELAAYGLSEDEIAWMRARFNAWYYDLIEKGPSA